MRIPHPRINLIRTLALFVFSSICTEAQAHPVQDDRARHAEQRQKDTDLAKPPEDFRLSGNDGRSYTLDSFKAAEQVTFISVSDSSDVCENASQFAVKFAESTSNAKHRIVLVHSGLLPDRKKWFERLAKKRVLLLWDPLQILSQRMGFETPGDHFVVNPNGPQIVSKGKWADLNKRVTADKKPVDQISQCLEPADRGINITGVLTSQDFQQKFAQPFMRACVRCHIFSRELDYFGSLQQVAGWRAMSLKTLEVGRMPGGYEPNPHGSNALGFDTDDVRWVARYFQNRQVSEEWNGTFAEDYRKTYQAEIDSQLTAVTNDLGQPDLVLQTSEPLKVRASGDMMYRYMMLSEPFETDRFVRAVVLKNNMTVIHHAHLIVVPRKITKREARELEQGNASAAAAFQKIYGAGSYRSIKMTANGKSIRGIRLDQPIAATFNRPFRFSLQKAGEGVRVPKGHALAVVFHMESVGKETIEQPEFRIYFAKAAEATREISQFTLTPINLTIPSGKEVRVRSEVEITEPITLERALVHMHYRGVSARILVQRKGQAAEEVVAVLAYHLFKLQNFYRFTNLKLEPGSKLITELFFDNTARNFANPDPEKTVNLGRASLDAEMHFPRLFYSKN